MRNGRVERSRARVKLLTEEEMRQYRNLLVGMRANFLIAAQAGLPLDVAYAHIVGRYYELAHEALA